MRTASLMAAALLSGCGAAGGFPEAPPPPPASGFEPPAPPPPAIEHRGGGPLLSAVEAGGDIAVHVHHHYHARPPADTGTTAADPATQAAAGGRQPLDGRRADTEPGGFVPRPVPDGAPAALHPPAAPERRELAGALRAHEGLRLEPYSIGGRAHECYGSLGSAGRARTIGECERLLEEDMASALADARIFTGGAAWSRLAPRQRAAVAELAYMVGRGRLLKFRDLRAALRAGDWRGAAEALRDSPPLVEDVGSRRVEDLAERLLDGA